MNFNNIDKEFLILRSYLKILPELVGSFLILNLNLRWLNCIFEGNESVYLRQTHDTKQVNSAPF